MERLEIYLSKVGLIFQSIFGLCILSLGLLVFYLMDEKDVKDMLVPAVGLTLMGLFFMVIHLVEVKDTGVKLILDEEGINIVEQNIFVYWKDITGFRIQTARRKRVTPIIFIDVYNRAEYIDKIQNTVVKGIAQVREIFNNEPLYIDSRNLEISDKALLQLLVDYWESYQEKQAALQTLV